MATFTTSTESLTNALVSNGMNQDEAAKAAAQASQNAMQGEISATAREGLWKALVYTLAAVLLICTVGVLWSVFDGNDTTASDVIVTLFTATLTGLLGLFVKAPNQA